MDSSKNLYSDKVSIDTMVQEIQILLPVEVLRIRFEKENGEVRELIGTLISELLPEREEGAEPKRKSNPDVQVVFDLEKQEFRSFRKDRLIDWVVVENPFQVAA